MKEEFKLLLLFTFIVSLSLICTVYYHEVAHTKIFSYANVPSHIEFSLIGGTTIPDGNFTSSELREQAMIGHGINESIGYISFPLILMICTTIFICSLYLGKKIEATKK